MNFYEMFFYYVGLISFANVILFLTKNAFSWMKNKSFVQDQKDFEIIYLKDKNSLLEATISSQEKEIEKLAELIYSNK